jgi:four helix bundle protein
MSNQTPEDIRDRTFRFALDVINTSERLPATRAGNILAKQLIRSGTSIGANAQEAVAAHSRNDFIYKNSLALKEARETSYWLRLIKAANLSRAAEIERLSGESDQITKIFGAIVSKARGKSKSAD